MAAVALADRAPTLHEPDGGVHRLAGVHVLHGRDEIGRTDPTLLADRVEAPLLLLLLLLLLGASMPVSVTQRALGVLAGLRSDAIGRVHPSGLVISRGDLDLRWWTWAGYRTNATLKATLGGLADETQRVDDVIIRLRSDLQPPAWRSMVGSLADRLCLPDVDEKALAGLKFSEALLRHLAEATLAARLADMEHAESVLLEAHRFES
jgi:ATP-dependent Lhr-like helicase